MHSRTLTVISIVEGAQGVASGVVSRAVTDADGARRPGGGQRGGRPGRPPADDAVAAGRAVRARRRLGRPAPRHRHRGVRRFAPALGEAFADGGEADRLLYGFAEHDVTSTFLATSTGLRRRYDQPTGRLELNAKSARPDPLGLGRRADQGLRPTSTSPAMAADLATRLDWARHPDRPAGRPVRDAAAALRRGRPDDLPVLDGHRPRRRGGPQRLRRPATAAARIGEQLTELPLHPALRPAPSPACSARRSDRPPRPAAGESVFDNGAPIAGDRLDRRRAC